MIKFLVIRLIIKLFAQINAFKKYSYFSPKRVFSNKLIARFYVSITSTESFLKIVVSSFENSHLPFDFCESAPARLSVIRSILISHIS